MKEETKINVNLYDDDVLLKEKADRYAESIGVNASSFWRAVIRDAMKDPNRFKAESMKDHDYRMGKKFGNLTYQHNADLLDEMDRLREENRHLNEKFDLLMKQLGG